MPRTIQTYGLSMLRYKILLLLIKILNFDFFVTTLMSNLDHFDENEEEDL